MGRTPARIVLGIESSCDETGVGIVADGKTLLANTVVSSLDLHAQYGGVVPEIAARSHIEVIVAVVEQALNDARLTWSDIDAIAVTKGAGLLGSLLIGVLTARTLAIAKNKPLYGVNHVEGHIYVNFLTETTLQGYTLPTKQPKFPMLGVIVSGGHTQLVLWRDHFDYRLLGQTRDDAIGEAFDKVARIIGLPYPGGISVERKADEGDPHAIALPIAKMQNKYDFSFSGLKTSVLRAAQELVGADYSLPSYELPQKLSDQQKAVLAASFTHVACKTIVQKAVLACGEFNPVSVVVGGGVAASPALRKQLSVALPYDIDYTDRKLCGDNGAMIATLGCYAHLKNTLLVDPYTLEAQANLVM